jgi:hypothetical protein
MRKRKPLLPDSLTTNPILNHRAVRMTLKYFLAPAIIYFVFFFLANRQYIGHFSTGFFLDDGDGYQNVWNIWWVHQALTVLHQNPYYTRLIHAPEGISLVPQTMNIYNCLVGVILFGLGMSLIQVVNFAVVFAFVMSGVTMFWFVRRLTKNYWIAVLAGFMFTFSSYHFAHAQGHLQLVTMEWVPLFFLAWWELLVKPRYKMAIAAAGALLLVIGSDYYYFFYSVSGALILLAFFLFYTKELKVTQRTVKIFALFTVLTAATSGVLVASLALLNKRDPLQGAHDAFVFSLDILSPIIPGGSWYWNSLTKGFWDRTSLPYFAEASMYFGSVLIVLLIVAIVCYRRLKLPKDSIMWWAIFVIFGILSLGPRLHINGRIIHRIPLPYAWLEKLIPSLQVSGVPIRMIFMSLFAGIIIASITLSHMHFSRKYKYVLIPLLIIFTLFDLWPRPLPLTTPSYLSYVGFIKSLPNKAEVIDNGAATGSEALYDQTVDDHPIAFGYVTRTPTTVSNEDFHIFADLAQGRYDDLCSVYRVRYLTTRQLYPQMKFPIIYTEHNPTVYVYDLKDGPKC